jgi:acyl dehydratase
MATADARHVMRQGRVIASLGGVAMRALFSPARRGRPMPALPGPELTARVAPPARALVRDYVRHVGGDPGAYRDRVPPHLFPQWGLPLAARALLGLPYPLLRIMNAGCRLAIHAPLPAGEPLTVRARLEAIDDDGRRAVLRQRLVTGTAACAEALVAELYGVVPSAAREGAENGQQATGHGQRATGNGQRREAPMVPGDARELERWALGRHAGLAFAALTGDFNPVHWVGPYARALGLPGTILHGFATLARAVEGLQRACFGGAVDRLRIIDGRFVRPLALPANVGLYLSGAGLCVGEAAGARACLVAKFEER